MICLDLSWGGHWIVENHLVWRDWPQNRWSNISTCLGNNSKVTSNQTQGNFQLTGFFWRIKNHPKRVNASSILDATLRCWVPHSTQLLPNVAGPSFPELVILPTSRYFTDCQCISPEHHSRLCTLLLLSSTDFHPLIENPPRNWRQQVVEFWKSGSLHTPVKGKQIIVTQKNLPQSPNRQVCSMTLFCALFLQV